MKTFLAVLLVALAFLPGRGGQTQIVEIPGEGATIELPSGWSTQPRPGAALFVQNGTSGLLMKVQPNDDNQVISGDALRQNALEMLKTNGTFTDINLPGRVYIHGVPAYSSWLQMSIHGQTGYGRIFIIPANRKVYLISMWYLDGAEDEETQKIGESFQFASPPEVPWDWMSLDYEKFIPYLVFAFFLILLMWGFQSAGDLFDRIFPTRFERVNRPRGGGYS